MDTSETSFSIIAFPVLVIIFGMAIFILYLWKFITTHSKYIQINKKGVATRDSNDEEWKIIIEWDDVDEYIYRKGLLDDRIYVIKLKNGKTIDCENLFHRTISPKVYQYYIDNIEKKSKKNT